MKNAIATKPNAGIGNYVRGLFETKKYENYNCEKLAEIVRQKFPESKINAAHVSCYRSRLRPEYQKHIKELKNLKLKSQKTKNTKKNMKKPANNNIKKVAF